MDIVYLLVPLSLVLVVAIGWAFVSAVRGGQFEDLDKEGGSILDDQ
jgi:cbb3-type cytochrome oxidase maturation protein